MTNCEICGRELTQDVSVTRGIGPICWAKRLKDKAERWKHPVGHPQAQHASRYRVELLHDHRICIIHEVIQDGDVRTSLTNSIEYVLDQVIEEHGLSIHTWSFVQHTKGGNLFGDYHDWDIVDMPDGQGIRWRYIWHSEAQSDKVKSFNQDLLIKRVNHYRHGKSGSAIKVRA
jgi:hypothetical protein